jgi:hypothetical protein
MLGVTAILVGTFFLGSLFIQRVLGATPIQTGLAFLPLVLVTGVASHVWRELLGRVGARDRRRLTRPDRCGGPAALGRGPTPTTSPNCCPASR